MAVVPATAADLYRWVDENGRTQMSDRPPPKAPGTITRQDSRQFEQTEGQRREAAARTARDRAQLDEAANRRAKEQEEQAARARAAASAAASAASAAASAPATTCDQLRERYYASQACYAPYRTRWGIRGEAFSVCGPGVKDPSWTCGMERKP